VRKAAHLLKLNGLSVAAVARKVEFASHSNFSRAFQAQFGFSPTEFRGQHW